MFAALYRWFDLFGDIDKLATRKFVNGVGHFVVKKRCAVFAFRIVKFEHDALARFKIVNSYFCG